MSRHENDDDDLRRANARLWHWCSTCHGHNGPGSPCYSGPEDEPEITVEWEHPCPFRGEPVLTLLGESCPACGLSAEDCDQ